jgi:predicted TPR repeat methyltransferase
VRLDPNATAAHLQLAALWLDAGEPDNAETEIAAAEKNGADEVIVSAQRAAIAEHRGLKRASSGFVRHLFDQFAGDYDERMRTRLGYAAPEILRDLCALLLGPPRKALDILDLGCGTGLSGAAFAPYARRLVGVDLSPGMLAKARALATYDQLLVADIEELPGDVGLYDLVTTADVLVYLGDLAKTFDQVRRHLKPEGLWALTTEKSEADDFALGPKRRYRHSERYLRAQAEAHDFEVVSLIECVTRYNAGVPVPSLAAILRSNA